MPIPASRPTCLRRAARTALTAAALLVMAGRATAAPLEIDGALGGWSRPGRQAELVLTLTAARPGEAAVEIRDGTRTITTRAALPAGVPQVLRLPLTAAAVVSVHAQLPGAESIRRDYSFRLAESPLIVWAAASAPPAGDDGSVVVPVGASTLPYLPAGYSSIDALVLDEDTLAHLDPDQAHALLAYLGDCGRALAVAVTPATLDALRAAAGCGARALAAEASAASAAGVLDRLLGQPLAEPVAFESLRGIIEPGPGAWPAVAAGITIYFAALAALLIARARLALVVIGVAGATACAAILPRMGHSAPALAVWAEAEPGAVSARYAARLELAATYPGRATLPIDPLLRDPEPCADHGRSDDEWSWDADQRRYTAVRKSLPLFGGAEVCFRGDFPIAARAARLSAHRAQATLTNSGPTAWGAGSALVSGHRYRLEALAPGQSQDLGTDAAAAPLSGAEELLAARGLSPGLLWPLPLPEMSSSRHAAAWLAVRAGVGSR
jgi:hypothetical protein